MCSDGVRKYFNIYSSFVPYNIGIQKQKKKKTNKSFRRESSAQIQKGKKNNRWRNVPTGLTRLSAKSDTFA